MIHPQSTIEVRRGVNWRVMPWSKLAFEYVGAKNTDDLRRITEEIEATGRSEWEGFLLTLKNKGCD